MAIKDNRDPGDGRVRDLLPNSENFIKFISLLVFLTLLFLSFQYLNIPYSRFLTMFGPLGAKFIELFAPPDFAYLNAGLLHSIVETFQLAFLGTVVGLALAVPLSWFGAFNMTPNKWVLYPLGRGSIVLSRSIYWLIWAIIFTNILGFGPLAGALTCVLGTLGFGGKLMAEEIEDIRIGPVEAIRATGGGKIDVFLYGVLPQVMNAWTGIAIYTWDSTFRAATILGYVGAGGIGTYLRESISMLHYSQTGMTLVVIIGLVIASEVMSAYARQRIA